MRSFAFPGPLLTLIWGKTNRVPRGQLVVGSPFASVSSARAASLEGSPIDPGA